MTTTPPRAPRGTGRAGRRLWSAITGDYDLAEHELAILTQAVRVADLLEQLDDVVREEGFTVAGRIHPAVVEARMQRIVLTRLIVALRVPLADVEGQGAPRTQYRGPRGVYGLGGAA